ncbi:hypothetical protein LBMAG33_2080 [Candidatus Levyibacteriota bacterium]|nr:hypothetical protein LBMAG33_2080 [Candidatus Levybacteria bacterium]
MNNNRFNNIDFIRAIAIICVIATHVYSRHLFGEFNILIWNYLHFTIFMFIFCSGYVLSLRYEFEFNSWKQILSWYFKRSQRLIIPFYCYLFVHYLLWYLFPQFFDGLELNNSFNFIVQSIFLTGGVNANWLVLLFIQLTVLLPLLTKIYIKKIIIIFYILFSTFFTIYITFIPFSYNLSRYVMWIPWSLALLFSIYASRNKISNKKYISLAILSGILFYLFNFLHPFNKSLSLYDHKYPSDLYYLSYEFFITFILLSISQSSYLKNSFLQKSYEYISHKSYSLYFIHYIVLDFIFKVTNNYYLFSNIFIQFLLILSISLFICWLLDKLSRILLI